ncbi:MAG: 4Fe-4S binding protein, partial [Clostridiales bacterium]|nr:4Fe-4S binding protein [Clostridiales bacterium]
MKGLRLWVQAAFAALTNGYVPGFLKGVIYRGPLKQFCVPGLNCYACPGALGSCPIGSLQAVLGSRDYRFSFYIVGFLMLVGAALGRFVCGWLCPIGLVQDLLYKIPFFKKRKKLPGDKVLVWLKYVMLVLFVILLPLFAVNAVGQSQPWFCKYVCPGGMLMGGIPLYLL